MERIDIPAGRGRLGPQGRTADWVRGPTQGARIGPGDRPLARTELRPELAECERRLGRKLPDRSPERRN